MNYLHTCRVLLVGLGLSVGAIGLRSQTTSGPVEKPPGEQSEEIVELTPFTVTTSADVGYGSLMNTSGRLAKAFVDVPQMASVVTSELISDTKRFGSLDATMFVPGASKASAFDQGTILRGMYTDAPSVNGFNTPPPFAGNGFDMAYIDRVEVIKGPAPTSVGRGNPAGFINYITKRPNFSRSTELDFMFGSGNDDLITQRYMLDNNGLVTADGQTAYRLVALIASGADTEDFSGYSSHGAMLAVERNLKGRGNLTVTTYYSEDKLPGLEASSEFKDEILHAYNIEWHTQIGENAPVFPLQRGGDFAVGYSSSHILSKVFSTTAELNLKLSDAWSTRQAANFTRSDGDADWIIAESNMITLAADGTPWIAPLRILSQTEFRQLAYQADFIGNFKIPAIDSSLEFLGGGDYARTRNHSVYDVNFPPPQPLYHSNPNIPLPGWSFNPNNGGSIAMTDDWSAYAQLQARFFGERLRLSSTARKNHSHARSVDVATGATTTDTRSTSPLLPAYTVLYKITNALSLYAMHSEYLNPASLVFEYSSLPASDPRSTQMIVSQDKTKLYEAGIKGTWLNGRIGFSACWYDLVQNTLTNLHQVTTLANGDTLSYNQVVPSTRVASGLEFESFGKITDKLTFLLSGCYLIKNHHTQPFTFPGQSSTVRDDIPLIGLNNTAAGYAVYSFSGSRNKGLSLTAGWKTYFSGQETINSGSRPYLYPNTRSVFDLGASYAFSKHWQVYVKVNDAFRKEAVPIDNQVVISGRQVFAGINAKF